MPLRPSQVETLRAVGRLVSDDPSAPEYGASPARVAAAIGRTRQSVEDSLIRLEELGHLEPVRHPLESDRYRLTQLGREALEGQR